MNRLQIKAWFGGKNKLDKDNSDAFADAVLVKSDDIITDATQSGGDTTVFSSKATKTLVTDEATARQTSDNTLAQSVTDLTTALSVIQTWKTALTDADSDSIINTLTELLDLAKNVPEGADLAALLAAKVSTSDIVDNLTSVLTNVPLSAYQGNVLKGLIDTLTNIVSTHTSNTTVHITAAERTAWTAKQAALVSGTSIKTINSTSLLGSGDIALPASPIQIVNSYSLFASGLTAGSGDTGVTYSNFFGYYAGYYATGASYSNFSGRYAGHSATSASYSNFFGGFAGRKASGADHSNFLGYYAGESATNANNSNFLGGNAGGNATEANNSNFFGSAAGYMATNACCSNFLGQNAGNGAVNASYSNFIGYWAGDNIGTGKYSNFLGYYTGMSTTNASYCTLLGYNVANESSGSHIGSNNIIIGTNITLPAATANALNIGGVLFGTGLYSTVTGNPSAAPVNGGCIGIGVVSPTETLDVSGNVKAAQFKLSALNTAPASSSDTGALGEIRITAGYIYVCVATNTWVRSALTTW
ncbi:MAG: hypothetical protein H6Q17_572 [Bacteroidetes bacterium]|nr:hypothetical protein [Bacteroidota bacterium]